MQESRDKIIGGGSISGYWDFTDNKNGISIGIQLISAQIHGNYPYPFVTKEGLNWEIIRLTNKEMWLKADYNGNNYFVKYKKIEE